MAIKMSPFIQANRFLRRSSTSGGIRKGHCAVYVRESQKKRLIGSYGGLQHLEVFPRGKGHCAVYVGESQKKRFVMPVSYLSQPLFQDLLAKSEEEFGFDHPMDGLTIPCKQDVFVDLTSRLRRSSVAS
ncbi:auxin-responsive protein SAUR21-like [Solanum stenotomum]|uniref:auxin-responsive protein SAUR21-like n=1 Tax=Solanum stenotomum TaxID=172797 RepID=UPI0020D07C09|nr:auxin-responsive protein SAUR21-like [Solanum stenotomum]